ncbi:nitroreductase/quinone reductase family protein [Candidatus Nitrososphaera sp. FF02]|uniref:nitroreductase/quinone reductase family protein n=1 Tax=Candidatus Nitrososphaera sp. FF02 TaxID=3398226 RepID=UPI0039EA37EF
MGQSQFLYLTTKGWKTGKQHEIEIWFVELKGRHYIVSEHMERSHWVQNVIHEPRVSFRVGNSEHQGTARAVNPDREPALAKNVAKLMDAKYGWSQGLIVELVQSAA